MKAKRCLKIAGLFLLATTLAIYIHFHCRVEERTALTNQNRFISNTDTAEKRSDSIPLTHHSFPSDSDVETVSSPNIIYLLADDLGYGDVEYNGGRALTPHLNAMAEGPHSIHFTRYYSGGPTCSPTRGTLLTGRNHNRYCIWHADIGQPCGDIECPCLMPLPHSEITVAEILKQAGYSTATFGKWHLGDLQEIPGGNKRWPVSHPGMHGFDDWLVTERDTFSVAPNCICYKGFDCTVDGRFYYHKTCRDYHYINPWTGKLEAYHNFIRGDSSFLVNRFEEYLKKAVAQDKPFFVLLSFHDVHSSFYALDPYYNMYQLKGYDERTIHYYGAISQLDEAVGKVRELLIEYGVSENTMLWFSSDNGPQVGTPGSAGSLRGMKGSVYEGGIRVPAIIEWPSVIKSNRRTDMPVVTSDFLPTVCDILDIKPPADRPIDGLSILPLLLDKSRTRNKSIGFAFHVLKGDTRANFSSAWSGEEYKLYTTHENGVYIRSQLFDMTHDIAEQHDVSQEHPLLVQQMTSELKEFIASFTESTHEVGCHDVHDRRDTDEATCYCPRDYTYVPKE